MQYNIARVESDNQHRRDVATKILTVCRQSMFGKQSSKENVAGNSELSFRSRSVAVFVPLSSSRLAEGTAPSNEGCNEERRESEGWKGIEVWWHCSQRSLSAIYGCAREEKRREREEKEKEREKERDATLGKLTLRQRMLGVTKRSSGYDGPLMLLCYCRVLLYDSWPHSRHRELRHVSIRTRDRVKRAWPTECNEKTRWLTQTADFWLELECFTGTRLVIGCKPAGNCGSHSIVLLYCRNS